LPWWTIPTEAL